MPDTVVMQFLEWHLATALGRQMSRDRQILWRLQVIRRPHGTDSRESLAAIFGEPDAPPVAIDEGFVAADAARHGIADDQFTRSFLALRPDFAFHGRDLSVLLEAKGRSAPRSTWTNPKKTYYQLLVDSPVLRAAGFFFVIPRSMEMRCGECVEKHFPATDKVSTGYILWEDLLPSIDADLLHVAVDELVHVSKGLQVLREWQKGQLS